MSYDVKKLDARRYAFTAVEIDLDINDPSLDAEFALDPSSFGTPKTTEDVRAFTGVDFKTYRYSDQDLIGVDHFPNLVRANSTPPEIKPGESVGLRATATITLKDFVTNDSFELNDAYSDRRVTGSHFAKLFARNQLKNRKLRVIRGYDPDNYDLANCRVENYVIDSWSGPDIQGNITINAVDVLKLTNAENAKVPEISKGTLTSAIDTVTTSIDYTSEIPDEYGAVSATGVIAIGKEQMTYTVTTAGTSGTLSVARGAYSSEIEEHEAGDVIQKCLVYDNENIMDIMADLIGQTTIPSSYIPTADWNALKAGDLTNYNLTRVITKPTEVKNLLNELIVIGGLSVYTDVVAQEIVAIASPAFDNPVITFNEREHFEQDTLRVSQAFDKLITRQAIYWSKRNYAEGNQELNYGKRFAVIDGAQEAGANLGVQEEGKEIKSDWLTNSVDGNQVATTIVQRNVNRFSDIPDKISFEVDSRFIGALEGGGEFGLGSVFSFETSLKINPDGTSKTVTAQCVKLSPSSKDDKWRVDGLTYKANIPANVDYYIEDDRVDYVLADDPDFSPILADGAREYVVVIRPGVTIGQDVNDHAFKQGVFPVGATLKVINAGRVLGKGGNGGSGGGITDADGTCLQGNGNAGTDGGDAWEFTTDATLDNSLGLIGGGGGGGRGGDGDCPLKKSGGGGGGGQGYLGGSGAAPGVVSGVGGSPGESGQDGTANYAGAGGEPNGFDGGGLGEDGGGDTGGAAGNAITTNGNTVTITAGNNPEQLKGAIA